jgi:hypothetical protein
VTRFGNFSPIGWLLSLGSFFYYWTRSQFLFHFVTRNRFRINFDKKWTGLHLGDFFTNSSGHPGRRRQNTWGAQASRALFFRLQSTVAF